MNLGFSVGLILKLFDAGNSIIEQVNRKALEAGKPTYTEQPKHYSFRQPGTVGFPPKAAITVWYVGNGENLDWGRFIAQ
jgi:hypothetical protein